MEPTWTVRGTVWTPQAGYAVAILIACLWWGASRPQDPIPPSTRPLDPAFRAGGDWPLDKLHARSRAAPTEPASVDDPLPNDSLPDEGVPQDGSNTLAHTPLPMAALPVARPLVINNVIRAKPLLLLGAQVTAPLGASVDLGIRWGRWYVGPVYSIFPSGWGGRVVYALF